jgi:Helix-turn-helix domain of transposase family ISL3
MIDPSLVARTRTTSDLVVEYHVLDNRMLDPQEHGVVVAHVPWARHGVGHTLSFDETVAWLATQCSKSAVTELMRIAWRTVQSAPYPGVAHAVLRSPVPDSRQARNLSGNGVLLSHQTSRHPQMGQKSRKSGGVQLISGSAELDQLAVSPQRVRMILPIGSRRMPLAGTDQGQPLC